MLLYRLFLSYSKGMIKEEEIIDKQILSLIYYYIQGVSTQDARSP